MCGMLFMFFVAMMKNHAMMMSHTICMSTLRNMCSAKLRILCMILALRASRRADTFSGLAEASFHRHILKHLAGYLTRPNFRTRTSPSAARTCQGIPNVTESSVVTKHCPAHIDRRHVI
uniref:Secreted protein n=1 Tax=Rhipicephalus zambeziensis TaxID=60191 RepID=A0A224YK67_9ACAR